MIRELKYYVYYEEINRREIIKYNIFDHGGFYQDLIKIKKEFKKAYKKFWKEHDKYDSVNEFIKWSDNYKKEVFEEAVIRSLQYTFWARCEYEIVLTDWPTHINKEEFDRIRNTDEDCKYLFTIDPAYGEKIDIFDQVMLNKDIFIDYLWANIDSVRDKR